MIVCATCGVEVAPAKNGRLIHLNDIPDGFDIFHDIVRAIPEVDYRATASQRLTLKGAAEDMLHHHAMLCPASTCQWAQVLQRALKQS